VFFPGVAGGRRGSPGVTGENSGGGPGKIRGRPGLFDIFGDFGGLHILFITRASTLLFLGQSVRGVAGEAFSGSGQFFGSRPPRIFRKFRNLAKMYKKFTKIVTFGRKTCPTPV